MRKFRFLLTLLQYIVLAVYGINQRSFSGLTDVLKPQEQPTPNNLVSSQSAYTIAGERTRELLQSPDDFITHLNGLGDMLRPESATAKAYKESRDMLKAHPEGLGATADLAGQWLHSEQSSLYRRQQNEGYPAASSSVSSTQLSQNTIATEVDATSPQDGVSKIHRDASTVLADAEAPELIELMKKKKATASASADADVENPFPLEGWAKMLRKKLIDKFGTDYTLMTMEWPGRVLDETSFKYPIKDEYSGIFKSLPVADAEFGLADELFPLARFSAGPTGQSLSRTYMMSLDELTESTEYGNDEFEARKRDAIQILNEKIEGTNETLRDRHERFLKAYVDQKRIQTEKINRLRDNTRNATAEKRAKWFDRLPSLLDQIHMTLNKYWTDLILMGDHHRVNAYLSFLDVRSPGEYLQETKNSMRNSGRRSLDGSHIVYPVMMQPRNWASSLTTKFTATDLTAGPYEVLQEVKSLQIAKESTMSEISQLVILESADSDNIEDAKDKVRSQSKQLTSLKLDLQDSTSAEFADAFELYCGRSPQNCKSLDKDKVTKAMKEIDPDSMKFLDGQPLGDDTFDDMQEYAKNYILSTSLANKLSQALIQQELDKDGGTNIVYGLKHLFLFCVRILETSNVFLGVVAQRKKLISKLSEIEAALSSKVGLYRGRTFC